MKRFNKTNLVLPFDGSLALMLVLLVIGVGFVVASQIRHRELPFSNKTTVVKAMQGSLHLAELLDSELYALGGEWEYYPQQLLKPEDFSSESPAPTMRELPFSEPNRGSFQTATLRLKVKTAQDLQGYSMDSGIINSASRAWVNGQLAWDIGDIQSDPERFVTAVRRSWYALPSGQNFEIVLQIANKDIGSLGFVNLPRLAHTATHFNERHGNELLNTLCLGFTLSLLVFCFYNMVLDRYSVAHRYFFLLNAAIFLKIVLQYPTVIYHPWFQSTDYLRIYTINYLTYNSISLLGVFTLNHLVPGLFNKKFLTVYSLSFAIMSLRAVFLKPASYEVDTNIANILNLVALSWALLGSFFSEGMGLRFRKTLRRGFFLTALVCVPAIILHFQRSSYASLAENIAYMNFVLVTLFTHSFEKKRVEITMRREVNKRRHAYAQLVKMVYPHQLQKIKAGIPLEDTMPTGSKKDCCVICFDVIDSSNLPSAKTILASIFSSCFELMIKNYDRYAVSSDAYRINEVGDGFYCSIGFPFASNFECSYAESAWYLALQFLTVVDQINQREGLEKPVQCSIGIAMGELSGFFTTSGIKRYDMYGEAIVLSTRYEQMRRTLMAGSSHSGHVIVLQEKVAMALPVQVRDTLEQVILDKDRMKVKNDETAEILYYRLVAHHQESLKKAS